MRFAMQVSDKILSYIIHCKDYFSHFYSSSTIFGKMVAVTDCGWNHTGRNNIVIYSYILAKRSSIF